VDAKARLEALHQPVPRPTRAALENNKKEEASRHEQGMMSNMLGNFEKHPDVAKASHYGDPTMVDPEPVTATAVVKQMTSAAMGGDNTVNVQTTGVTAAPNQEPPRSDPAVAAPDSATADAKAAVADPNELKPNVVPDPNALPPLQQTNELANGSSASSASASSAPAKTEEMADISSSKKKKKKGISKLNPF